ncbi:TIGR01777 family oxidoreductase [Kutzneria sp. CA-103260]|uniref:TIGR01777 family oxidoreductase n=1 Tax=Kutzneria sp. CA-103260 TaxID=2802641 RepID=UPI001BA98610|nr:TIGR01777 family oxidoreductase [Kutzneria sp. CA-103260]QUQ67002.1 NAD-dependent nucleoside-diphosphate sugar epimerase [Kutzneria sp. CA-103260]
MRVVVAGASGVIGTALTPVLRSAGHEVLRLVRRSPSAPDERQWDPVAGTIADGALDGVDAVINLCAVDTTAKRWTPEFKKELTDSRVVPTRVLAEAVAAQGVPALLNSSSVAYYGDTGDQVVDESVPAGTGFLADMDREREEATKAALAARVVLLRTGIVLSPTGGLLGQLRPMVAWGAGGRMGTGRQYLAWISLHDEVAAIQFALEHKEISGPVNLSGPQPVTNAEMVRAVGRLLHRPTPWVYPPWLLRLFAGELADAGAMTGQRAVPDALIRHGFEFRHPTVSVALAAAL